MDEKNVEAQVPSIIYDKDNKREYRRGAFLGKGGFAKCWEMTDTQTNLTYAGKIIPKSALIKSQAKDKLKMEIKVHKRLQHPNIVGFHSCFDDGTFVYIILEICKRRSLMEMHKRRKAVTEPEARFFCHQILLALVYIHSNQVIHRDLKLGNLFLSEDLDVKVGDFGLATEVMNGERKQTICGTPNYIAPEVLHRKGHSYEVDIWAVGCILYTLLCGKPPFETQTLKETYNRIKLNAYQIPPKVNAHARHLIKRLLSPIPATRPTAEEVLQDEFFKVGLLPNRLPQSCLTMTPRFDRRSTIYPTHSINKRPALSQIKGPLMNGADPSPNTMPRTNSPQDLMDESSSSRTQVKNIQNLLKSIESCLDPSNACSRMSAESECPELIPIYWISKWVDYSDKYGLSYQLCDGSVGVLYNDDTRITQYEDGETVQFIDKEGVEVFFTLSVYSPQYAKKVTLLKYFYAYMNEHLVQTGTQVHKPESDVFSRLPFLLKWFRTKHAIVMALNNGTVQINFFKCHSKLVFCPFMQAVTYIDVNKEFHVIRISDLKSIRIPKDLQELLKHAMKMLDTLYQTMSSESGLPSGSSGTQQKYATVR